MSEYNQSVVMICDDANKADVNAYFDGLGLGPATLSIELRGAGDSVWWGSHAWWYPAALPQLELVPDALDVITSVRPDAQAQQHWNDVLQALGLSVPHSGL